MSLKSILNDSSRQSQSSSRRKPSQVSSVAEQQPVNVKVKSEQDESNLDIDEVSPKLDKQKPAIPHSSANKIANNSSSTHKLE